MPRINASIPMVLPEMAPVLESLSRNAIATFDENIRDMFDFWTKREIVDVRSSDEAKCLAFRRERIIH